MTALNEKIKLDDIDLEILRILQREGRITNAKLAAHVGLSAPPMLERVKKLERQGIIKSYRAILDAERLGLSFFVFVAINLNVSALSEVGRFEADLATFPEILECHHIAGDIDFLLKVNVGDQEAYKRFVVDHLAKIPGINRIHSWVVLATIKESTELLVQDRKQKRGVQ